MRRRVVRARPFWPLILSSILLLLLPLGRWVDSGVTGFRGEHFRDGGFRRPPALTTNDSEPSTSAIIRAWSGTPPDTLSADWTGWILIPGDGDYAFATRSDDHSWVLLDGETVIDNPGGDGEIRGTRRLSGGMHWLRVRYQQTGGHRGMGLLWDAGKSGPLTPVPTWRVRADRVSPWRVRWARGVSLIARVLWWTWAASVVVAVLALLWIAVRALRRELVSHEAGAAFAAILVVTLVLNTVGIWWGMPSAEGWAPDELLPQTVLDGMGKAFSQGWFAAYPLFHFYLLAVSYLPILGLEWLWGTPFDLSARHVALVIAGRFVSVLMASGTLIAVYLATAELFGRRAALYASIVLGLATPFVFYAKTSNVDGPYVFWFAVSLVFYLRLLQTLALRNFVLFAITATLAVCTKDQAYALYALMPLPVLIALWNQGEAPVGRRWRNLFDWRIAAAVGAALVTFAVGNNLVLNPRGFVTHFNFVTAQYYEPSFEAGIAGRAALSGFVARQIAESLSWPSTIAAVWGLVVALRDPALRFAGWTLVPVVSYWLVFLNVIRYSFDRFLLPVCVVAAIFAGFAFARFLATGQWWRRATAAGALSFTVLYALPVDMMMVSDARYTAERWVNSRKSPGDRIGMLGFKYMPLLPRGSYQVLVTLSELRWFKPTYVMVNADYTRRRPVTTTERAALAALDAGELGYRRLFSERSSVPWDWMPGMHPSLLGDRTGPSFSNLEHINPRMEIFVRDEN